MGAWVMKVSAEVTRPANVLAVEHLMVVSVVPVALKTTATVTI